MRQTCENCQRQHVAASKLPVLEGASALLAVAKNAMGFSRDAALLQPWQTTGCMKTVLLLSCMPTGEQGDTTAVEKALALACQHLG